MTYYAYDEDGDEISISVYDFYENMDSEEREEMRSLLGLPDTLDEVIQGLLNYRYSPDEIVRSVVQNVYDFDFSEVFGEILGSQIAALRTRAENNKRAYEEVHKEVDELREKLYGSKIILDGNLVHVIRAALALPKEQFHALPDELIDGLRQHLSPLEEPVEQTGQNDNNTTMAA